jgi:magnesium chelatase family protein
VQIVRYRSRLSGPLRDRLDLTVDVPALPPDALGSVGSGEPSLEVRARVVAARARQTKRYADDRIRTNAELSSRLMLKYALPERAGLRVLANAVKRFGLSARGYDRVRKVARTIADLAGHDQVEGDDVAEALQFRPL